VTTAVVVALLCASAVRTAAAVSFHAGAIVAGDVDEDAAAPVLYSLPEETAKDPVLNGLKPPGVAKSPAPVVRDVASAPRVNVDRPRSSDGRSLPMKRPPSRRSTSSEDVD